LVTGVSAAMGDLKNSGGEPSISVQVLGDIIE